MARVVRFNKKRDDLLTELGNASCRVVDLQTEYACSVWAIASLLGAMTFATGVLQFDALMNREVSTGIVVSPQVIPFAR